MGKDTRSNDLDTILQKMQGKEIKTLVRKAVNILDMRSFSTMKSVLEKYQELELPGFVLRPATNSKIMQITCCVQSWERAGDIANIESKILKETDIERHIIMDEQADGIHVTQSYRTQPRAFDFLQTDMATDDDKISIEDLLLALEQRAVVEDKD